VSITSAFQNANLNAKDAENDEESAADENNVADRSQRRQ